MVINEIAWAGTATSSADEWIELYNAGNEAVDISGWVLRAEDGTPEITLSGTIGAGDYYLLERTNESTIRDITADQTYTGALKDDGEVLVLLDAQEGEQDRIEGWYVDIKAERASMERIDASGPGNDPQNWAANDGLWYGEDAEGDPIHGTPTQKNSVSL